MTLFEDKTAFSTQLKQLNDFASLGATVRVCVTKNCNLHCPYCHKEGMTGEYNEPIQKEDYLFIAQELAKTGFRKAKFTGGEPFIINNLNEIIHAFKKAGFDKLSIVTNGTLLNEEKIIQAKKAGLDRITISLDTLSLRKAKELNGSNLEKIIENIQLARKHFDEVKINTVILPGFNFPNEMLELADFCRNNKLTLKLLSKLDDDTPFALSAQAISIIKQSKHLTEKTKDENKAVPSTKYTFSDGTIVEVNDFRNEEYRKKLNEFEYCKNCKQKKNCIEGPYAVRVLPNGDIKPCMARNDNLIKYEQNEKKQIKLICLTGLASSGKSHFREMVEKKFGIKSIYIGDTLKHDVIKKGKEPTYENIIEYSKEIYEKEGELGVIKKSFKSKQKEIENEKILIIDSVRSTAEYDYLSKKYNTTLIGLVCSMEERIKRAKKGFFKLSEKDLLKRDKLEMGETDSAPKFNVGELLGHAKYYLSTESKDFEEKAEKVVKEILKA